MDREDARLRSRTFNAGGNFSGGNLSASNSPQRERNIYARSGGAQPKSALHAGVSRDTDSSG